MEDQSLAQAKAAAFAGHRPGCIVVGGDTVVALPESRIGDAREVVAAYTLLGKPADPAEAREMLRRLSGIEHEVITGVAIATPHGMEVFCSNHGRRLQGSCRRRKSPPTSQPGSRWTRPVPMRFRAPPRRSSRKRTDRFPT